MNLLSNKRWYVIETNYDRTKLEPIKDVRKTYAVFRMEIIGMENMSEEEIFEKVKKIKKFFYNFFK
jgi:hypothetical protein